MTAPITGYEAAEQQAFLEVNRMLQEEGATIAYFRRLAAVAAAGHRRAMVDYAMWLLEGKRSGKRIVLARSPRRAVALLRAAAALRDPMGQLVLADCLSEGVGVVRDLSEAELWYRKAARQGESFAAFNLATLFRDRGLIGKERHWLKKASLLGDVTAKLVLAELDLQKGGKRASEARQYLRRALKAATLASETKLQKFLNTSRQLDVEDGINRSQ